MPHFVIVKGLFCRLKEKKKRRELGAKQGPLLAGAIKDFLEFEANCFEDLEMKTLELKQILPISA